MMMNFCLLMMMNLFENKGIVITLFCFLFLRLRRVFEIAFFVEHAIGGTEHDEFSSAVELVANLLVLLALLEDEVGGQLIAFFQPFVFLRQLFRMVLGCSLPYPTGVSLSLAMPCCIKWLTTDCALCCDKRLLYSALPL